MDKTNMNKKKIFDRYLTNHYSVCEKTNFRNNKEVLALLRKNKRAIDRNLKVFFDKEVNKKNNILDLGCGYGSFLFFLQSHHYKNVTGIDISPEEIALCRKLFKSYKFHREDMFNYLRDTKEKFGVVYLSHVLEHVKKEQLFDFLGRVRNILNDNGFFIIVVPNSAAYFSAAANRYGDLTHEIGFTDKSLSQALMQTGFKNIEIKNYSGAGNFWLNALRKITLFLFEMFIQILGYDKQDIYTLSLLAIVKK